MSTTGKPRLLDHVREVLRLGLYSIHTERTYCAKILSTSMILLLKNHFAQAKALHEADLAQGHGEVYLPHALAQKYPGAGREWGCRRTPAPANMK